MFVKKMKSHLRAHVINNLCVFAKRKLFIMSEVNLFFEKEITYSLILVEKLRRKNIFKKLKITHTNPSLSDTRKNTNKCSKFPILSVRTHSHSDKIESIKW